MNTQKASLESLVSLVAVVIPALNAERTIATVVEGCRQHVDLVIVVDDGSQDRTADCAHEAGAVVERHAFNRGKGAALRTGLVAAGSRGRTMVVTLDADGQHRPSDLPKLLLASSNQTDLVLGVRNLARAGAPLANQRSNAFSNWFLSHVSGLRLRDTQCGMRRYPVEATLSLGVQDEGFGFESEVLLRAARSKLRIVHTDIDVIYPQDRTSHFDPRRDPWRIVGRVLRTLLWR